MGRTVTTRPDAARAEDSTPMRGVSLEELQELLGHSTLAMTMRYAHLAPEHLRSAVSRLAGLTSGQVPADRAEARADGVDLLESAGRK